MDNIKRVILYLENVLLYFAFTYKYVNFNCSHDVKEQTKMFMIICYIYLMYILYIC